MARRAEALARAGSLEQSQQVRAEAQRRFEAAGSPGDALVEQAERAWILVRMGRSEAAGRELVAAVAGSKGTGAAPRVQGLRLRIALLDVQEGRVDEAAAQQRLGEIGEWLFDAGRPDDLAALAALHVDRAIGAGDAAAALAAADHAIDFERQFGLADEGWRALDARALAHEMLHMTWREDFEYRRGWHSDNFPWCTGPTMDITNPDLLRPYRFPSSLAVGGLSSLVPLDVAAREIIGQPGRATRHFTNYLLGSVVNGLLRNNPGARIHHRHDNWCGDCPSYASQNVCPPP